MASISTWDGELCYMGLPNAPTCIAACRICNKGMLGINHDWAKRDVHLACFKRTVPPVRYRRLVRMIGNMRFPTVMSAEGNYFIFICLC